jgi:hypothetical protein
MKSIEQELAVVSPKSTPKITTLIYWVVTGLFCLQMSFTAYAQLSLPQVAEMFTHLGFPTYFRVELSWAKLLGVILLLAPSAGNTSIRRQILEQELSKLRPVSPF